MHRAAWLARSYPRVEPIPALRSINGRTTAEHLWHFPVRGSILGFGGDMAMKMKHQGVRQTRLIQSVIEQRLVFSEQVVSPSAKILLDALNRLSIRARRPHVF